MTAVWRDVLNGARVVEVEQARAPAAIQFVDWDDFWLDASRGEDWLVEPFLPSGRQVVVYAITKAGKSLLALEVAAAKATGRAVLDQAAGAPIDVLYLDFEMTEDDLRERLEDLGYGPDDDLSRLHYALLPSLPPLDTPEGGKALLALLDEQPVELAVFDTFGRAVGGDENTADTVRSYYRNAGVHLKARGVTVLRTDHQGKDEARGQRGTSAKAEDVDVVWHLAVGDERPDGCRPVKLVRAYSRVGWVPAEVKLSREGDPLRHVRSDAATYPAGTLAAVQDLDDHGAPLDATKRAAAKMLKDNGIPRRGEIIVGALRYRRERARNHARNHPLDDPAEPVGGTISGASVEGLLTREDGLGTNVGTTRNHGGSPSGNHVPPLRGEPWSQGRRGVPEEPFLAVTDDPDSRLI